MEPVNNSSLNNAVEVLDSISDVGKALPFVAPAFILLKIIIDIERRAQDVDLKCNDLVERITFMLSHLPILKEMEIMPATKQVVERINEAMKEAAALISAYRKQSKVARRLSLTNREKFTLCVDNVNTCTSDLLLSLQIHQSKQLDILTRAVPMDDFDEAAATFVEEHGGDFEAVKYDRELVKEFAEQQKLEMDDQVMDQLEEDVSDVVQEVQARLETVIKENVADAIANGFKSVASQLIIPEPEQRLTCVQCEEHFTRSSNHPQACNFHRAEFNSWSKSYPCCDTKHPCQFSSHREKHHCDYPYGTFFPRARNVNNYTDTRDEWAAIKDIDMEDDDKVQKASVSQLLRWVSRGARLEEPTILISVGTITFREKYYWNTFTVSQLENISKSVRHSKRTLIFRTSPSEEEFAMAEWLLSISGKITGVRITAKAATSPSPFVRVVPIDVSTGKQSGDVIAVSDGGMRSYIPATPYVLPETVRVGPELSDKPIRAPRTDFKTRTSTPNFRVILKPTSEPLVANPNYASPEHDFFNGSVSVFNNNAPGSNLPISIAGAKAQYRFVGEKEYKPVKSFKLEGNMADALPLTIDPKQGVTLKFEATVPRSEEDIKDDIRWWNRAYCARHRPLRLKLILEEIEGEECSLVLEYVFTPFPFDKPRENDIASFYFDDPKTLTRHLIRVEEPWSSGENVLRIDGEDVSVKLLNQTVYRALKTGKTEIDLELGREKSGGEWEWKAWALVDISCRRVYAFKILLQQGQLVPDGKKQFACMGYVLCPEYGESVQGKTRPVSYATEMVKIATLGLAKWEEGEGAFKQDDTVDDVKPPVPPKPNLVRSVSQGVGVGVDSPLGSSHPNGSAVGGGPAVLQVPEELNRRLASLDANLERIATALEQLVGALQTRGV
ncbi:hypothetical protein CC1G_01026 [Coprinopsis cinerea okayama7|uniref:Uncharacterized protein n=1 Tax=Coprinopsis cinerea (strain Okayama-7 / 130 / ATCC MYA-4618 / FGSC 9003) TaxID=240176 RepID=A8NE94_COPC7|nr:hypothetical protein CC1G_01026 [Coprinopsis cinerea okayama7\|eukprot:XP_001832964.2 hypothetical protein CC1G_01026 [Coprinopsis cinerea okayama7\